jgi:hypothetical protein
VAETCSGDYLLKINALGVYAVLIYRHKQAGYNTGPSYMYPTSGHVGFGVWAQWCSDVLSEYLGFPFISHYITSCTVINHPVLSAILSEHIVVKSTIKNY